MSTQPVEINIGGRQGRVLSVDDSPVVRALVRGYLHTGGYQVEEAESGAEALRHLAAAAYDVVITDLHMPELDGFALLSAVKREAPGTEVVFLTGAHDVNSTIRAIRLGAHDYLTKPLTNADAVIVSVQRALEKRRLYEEHQQLLNQLEAVGQTDRLTGLANRRAFEESLARETARALRHGHALSVVLLEIDNLRDLNDAHGHKTSGDEILRSFARTLTGNLRAGDGLYRHGHGEFVALLPHADLIGAQRAADRLVDAVGATQVMIDANQVSIQASAGVAYLAQDTDRSTLLSRAFAALHEAKNQPSRRREPSRRLPRAVSDGDIVPRARRRTD